MNGYYITKNNPTVKVILEPQDNIQLSDMNLIKLVLPIGGKRVWCEHNKLKELIIPKGYIYVNCHDNKLTKLIVSKNCHVWCSSNKLPKIIVNLFSSDDPVKIELANSLQR